MCTRDLILQHIEAGHVITPVVALKEYGTLSLPYHIFALRKAGYKIRTRLKSTFNGRRYAEYSLISECDNEIDGRDVLKKG